MLNTKANWDQLWSAGFTYHPLTAWAKDIFIAIAQLLQRIDNPKILSAGCGTGVIDYWLVKTFGYHVTFLDNSAQCIQNLEQSLKELNPSSYSLSQASIFDIPFPDKTFDVVWNEGVLEHFTNEEYFQSLKEMKRVSNNYVLIDVPNANCKPYTLAKKWLEENDMWGYGYERPRSSLKKDFKRAGLKVLSEQSIGNEQTINNYLAMVPEEHRHTITEQLTTEDYTTYPHIMTIGQVSNESLVPRRSLTSQ